MIRFADDQESDGGFDLPSSVGSIFKEDGSLEKVLEFEHRPEQHQMANAMVRSLSDNRHLLFEAGTGVGKSLAYLNSVGFVCDDSQKTLCRCDKYY